MTIEEIKIKLEDAFPGATIELINTSSMHVGHGAKGYHLKTTIEYSGFCLLYTSPSPRDRG